MLFHATYMPKTEKSAYCGFPFFVFFVDVILCVLSIDFVG